MLARGLQAVSKNKHTPSPWDIESNGPTSIGSKPLIIVDGGKVLTFGMDGEEGIYAHNEADIPLMNAAPDLLALLEELIAIEGPQPGNVAWFHKVTAAIKKARGE